MYTPIKGKTLKKTTQPTGRDFAESVGSVSGLVADLKYLKDDVIKTVDTELEKVDTTIKYAHDRVKDIENKAETLLSNIEDAAVQVVKDIHALPQIKGEPGLDADEKAIEERVLSEVRKEINKESLIKELSLRIPAPIDENMVIKKLLAVLPENKASLKIIQEKIEMDAETVLEKLMSLPVEKVKFKMSQIEGLEATISSYRNQLAKSGGYLHGGGLAKVSHDNTLTGDGTPENPLKVAGSGTGDVVGPASAVDNDITLFDGTTGKLIKDSGKKLSDYYAKTDFVPSSAGLTSIPSVIDNGNGSITIGTISCDLFSSADGNSAIASYTVAGGTFTLTDQVNSYAVVSYNSGSPALSIITDVSLINETTVIPVLTLFRQGTEIHAENWDQLALALPNKLNQSIVKTQRFRRESGLSLSEASTRKVMVSSGVSWRGAVRNTYTDFDSSIGELHFWYHSGGNWTQTVVTQYNNTQYDDGTNLQSLSAGKYAVNYIYRCASYIHNDTFVILGGGDYNLNQAQASQPPANLPPVISAFGILVGRIIVAQGASTSTQIDSAFVQTFTPSPTTNHNDLSGIQDAPSPVAGEHYHLNSAQATAVSTLSSTYAPLAGATFTGLISTPNVLEGYRSQATAAGTTTLVYNDAYQQEFTGTTTQTVKLPTTSVVQGQSFVIINSSTGAVTVQSSGANTICILAGGYTGQFTAKVATPTTAANWSFNVTPIAAATTAILVGGGTTNSPVWTTATGSGAPVRATSPTLATSVIGSASMDVFNTTSTTVNAFGAATTLNVGGTPTTAVTHNYSANATATGTTKTVNLATGAAAGSTTNVNIGSTAGGTLTVNAPNTSLGGTTGVTTTGTIELGATSDTTIARVSAGQISVEGVQVVTTSNTVTQTNKRITKRVLALSANSATPAINTDNYDVVHITAQTTAITSFTSSLTGTPVDGDTLRISITGTTSVAITWGTSFEASTVALPTTTSGTTRLDIGFFWNTETSKWRCVAVA